MEWNWNKTSIDLPYSYKNLKTLLEAIYKGENQFPQIDFCMWCDNLTMAWDEEDLDEQDQLAFGISQDIEAQWDLHWYELYSHEQMMKMDLTRLELPTDWFKEWAAELAGK